jgi:hypothetical protein
MEDFLDAAGLDEIRRPLNGILGNKERSSGQVADNPRSTSFALLRTALCRSVRNEGSRVLADQVTFSYVVKNLWQRSLLPQEC